jgi:hypothetical protein
MTKEFTLKKVPWDCRTIEREEGAIPALALHVYGASDEFFTRACFALDQDR